MVLATLRGEIVRQVFSVPWIVTIGGMCYTIYLYHFLLITALSGLVRGLTVSESFGINMALQAALILPPMFAVCMVLFLLFEKPFMAVGRCTQKVNEQPNTTNDDKVLII